ncbi:MAG: ATP-binding protein [Burkholderiales bacterium]
MIQEGNVQATREVSVAAFRAVFERGRDMCLALERSTGRIIRCNDVVRAKLGFSSRDILGQPISKLARPSTNALYPQDWNAIDAKSNVAACEVEVARKNGGYIDAHMTQADVRDATGRLAFGVALLRARPPESSAIESHPDNPERLRALIHALSVAEERERRRIAAGLHDELGQLLAITKLKVGRLADTSGATEREALINDIRGLIDQAAKATRTTTFELSSPVLQQLGLDAAIQSCGDRMQDLYGFRFSFQSDRTRTDLPYETTVVLLRVVRELLFNIHKHARARTVNVAVKNERGLVTIRTSDDGVGFSTATRETRITSQGGFGLLSAEGQIHAIGGQMVIDSSPGAGTRVTISVLAR